MTSKEQLEQFYPFDEAVIDQVRQTAAWQNRMHFSQLADYYDIGDGPEVVPAADDHKAFQVLTIKPGGDYDHEQAMVYHLPMSLPIDQNMTMRMLRLFGADESRQLIVAGNPSAAGQKYGKLRFRDLRKVWGGDLSPTVDPLLKYLIEKGISRTDQVGFSYGADKAAAASARAVDHDIAVERGVWMETAASRDYGPGIIGLARLGIRFMSAADELDNYVESCDSQPLMEAREFADVGLTRYLAGLARASNLAIGNALAHGGFRSRTERAMIAQPEMHTTLVWGTNSELVNYSRMLGMTITLRRKFGEERIDSMIMEGMHHAGGDQIDLHAAIVLQALRPGRRLI
ncbi:MAG TPA: hypothetical protein VL989_00430 [Candidatus Sulfotelmatobacter sp.]|nr:hypothetical protein [Candidatus Sulfotelmatobacter sp.]